VEQMNRARAERVSELLRRYMWARCRCFGGEAPALPLSELAGRLQWGPCEFDGVRVELNLEPPIVWDREQPAFFRAIIEFDEGWPATRLVRRQLQPDRHRAHRAGSTTGPPGLY
jgi:hypothetical protein